jgi:2-amino-4-hydroxy-6-hydroxymethyldihydropteridine diphosphokinase
VVADIRAGLQDSIDIATRAGVDTAKLIVDPGFGFGWEPAQNLELLRRLAELRDTPSPASGEGWGGGSLSGHPLLIGTSRKSTVGLVLDKPEGERLWGTAATIALAIEQGVDIVRVHDVAPIADAVRAADAATRPWPPAERRVWFGLGGNLGERLAHLRAALDALLAGGVGIDVVSPVYETPPWGVTDQPRFANIAVAGHTTLSARDLLALAKRIEAAAGRDLHASRNSARPIDVDIVAIDGEEVDDPDLHVPHIAMHERAFVLVPLADVASDWRHPRLRRTTREFLAEVDASGITRLADWGWWEPPRR